MSNNLQKTNGPELGEPNFERFTVDAALLRELGERLVGKPHIALAELVKNSYDADATKVTIRFGKDTISVIDNGDGMSPLEFKNFWLRIGTTHKQASFRTERNRQVTGSKGVGRLSVQFLGDKVDIVSRSKDTGQAFSASVDWTGARQAGELVEAGALVRAAPNITSIDNQYGHGTVVTISLLKKVWYNTDLQELAKELWFLKPPSDLLNSENASEIPDVFDVTLDGVTESAEGTFTEQMNQALENWIAVIEGKLNDGRQGGPNEVKLTFRDGDSYPATFPTRSQALDKAHFKIYIFKLSGKQTGGVQVGAAREYFKKFGGVHIYDNSFRLPFYGGDEQDWLQLEIAHSHRLNKSYLLPSNLQVQSGLNDLPTNSRIFGIVNISTSHERIAAGKDEIDKGRYLNVQVTRDRLIDNDAFEELQHSVRWAMDFYAMRSYERRQRTIASHRLDMPDTQEKVSEIREELFQISLSAPSELAQRLEAVSSHFEELEALEAQRKSAFEEERVLLAALATTGMAAIAMEHEMHKELTILNDIRRRLNEGGSVLNEPVLLETLNSWAERTANARKLFSPLMHESDREKRNSYNGKKLLAKIVDNSEILLRGVHIVNAVPENVKLPSATLAAWNAVFQNVLINAVNAMLEVEVRSIRCSGEINDLGGAIYISDTGVGVRLKDSDDLFKPFIRRLEIPEERKALGMGGMGIGLTIVKMVADSVDCKVHFIEPHLGYKTTFKIEWSEL
ncbi:ATP-binding protein [Pseudomonas sp. SZMC_28357]|uniref:ATP-binding protein n=1 Tax=Pseudomonas sp. SZMC_28357 TaxID=3074380 RepID=UPI002872A3BC|nr:ATP-binding protein [Pseudomonas sp. SZMC_28357]MDR9750995.1 ATP-binding protein [Pseudomonas sp. SZMC_28357]